MSKHFKRFAIALIEAHDKRPGTDLLDFGPKEQAAMVVERLTRFDATVPLTPVTSTVVKLGGFGAARVRFTSAADSYLLLSDVADSIGWPLQRAVEWAHKDYGQGLREQRMLDERRDDGLLGWECMRGVLDLRVSTVIEDPTAKPDADGRRWSFGGDWLISHDRVPSLLMSTPMADVFLDRERRS
ncbi:hypothetical protein ACIO6U_03885 [Streptomyces sp. NPDC087422]|uniref:hypothetical protein n=1 Tax=Streptomyces sp. NPDC087422 TaxID=3365786 RepID=UPI003820E1A1